MRAAKATTKIRNWIGFSISGGIVELLKEEKRARNRIEENRRDAVNNIQVIAFASGTVERTVKRVHLNCSYCIDR